MATARRALHFVFKVADRTATAKFYREVLGMKVSRSACSKEPGDEASRHALSDPMDSHPPCISSLKMAVPGLHAS